MNWKGTYTTSMRVYSVSTAEKALETNTRTSHTACNYVHDTHMSQPSDHIGHHTPTVRQPLDPLPVRRVSNVGCLVEAG